MVFNQNLEKSEEQKEEKIVKKIFTCSELEEINNQEAAMKSISTSTNNLQHDDPAVLFSSSKKLTRYDKAQLISMQALPNSKLKPPCFYDARVIQFDILKSQNSDDGGGFDHDRLAEERVKMLQQNLQTLNLQNWNSSIYNNFKIYQNALLDPKKHFNHVNSIPLNIQSPSIPPSPPVIPQPNPQNNSNSRRRVTFDIDQQQAALNNILPYDRKTVFFDTLTTTTMMRPPQKMGNYSIQQPRKNNSLNSNRRCSLDSALRKNPASNYSTIKNENFPSSMFGPGYFLANDGSFIPNGVHNNEKSAFSPDIASNAQLKKTNSNKEEVAEAEPEWFSFPATRHDFVDLHGFDEEEEALLKSITSQSQNNNEKKESPKFNFGNSQKQMLQSHSGSSDNGNFYNPHNNHQFYQRKTENSYIHQNSRLHNQFYNRNAGNNNNNQRFRNPFHDTKSPVSPKTPTLPPASANEFASLNYQGFQPMNPFYEAWKSDRVLNHRNVNFAQLMQNANLRQLPPTMKLMSEVEQGIIQNSQPSTSALVNMNNIGGGNIQQFFQNFSSTNANPLPTNPFNLNQQPIALPTNEQLQQHTSEILRKAILRNREKQLQELYHDKNNQQQQ